MYIYIYVYIHIYIYIYVYVPGGLSLRITPSYFRLKSCSDLCLSVCIPISRKSGTSNADRVYSKTARTIWGSGEGLGIGG